VQKRGAAIIAARKLSSAGSAAAAVLDSVNAIAGGTAAGDWTSLAVPSRGEYGVPEGIQFGYPVATDGGSWHVVEGIEHGEQAKERIRVTTEELLLEQSLVKELIPA
jgi:malate dehydrogenase